MAIAAFWKVEDNKYTIQFSQVKPKEKSTIFNLLNDWNETGNGYHRDGTELFLFSKSLLENEDIYKFVKSMPFPVTEEKKSGESKKIKTLYKEVNKKKDLTSPKIRGKISGGRICSQCGQAGHNKRTCRG